MSSTTPSYFPCPYGEDEERHGKSIFSVPFVGFCAYEQYFMSDLFFINFLNNTDCQTLDM